MRRDLADHRTEFEWGYGGSGPAQLALAILADCLGDNQRALALHQAYKKRVIQVLERGRIWKITEDQVRATVEQLERERTTYEQIRQSMK